MFGMASLSSCSEDLDEVQLAVDETYLNVGEAGGTVTVSIRANADWKVATGNHSWVSFDRTSGSGDGELKITVEQNSYGQRSGMFVIYAGTEYVQVEIVQAESTTGLSITTENCTITRTYDYNRWKYVYTITAFYTISGSHLASECGVLINNNKYESGRTVSDGRLSVQTKIYLSSSDSLQVTYQVYAVNKLTGKTIYGASKIQKY